MSRFDSKSMYRVSLSSSVSSGERELASKIKKNITVLKPCQSGMTDGREEMGDRSLNHSMEDTAQRFRTDGCIPETKASGETLKMSMTTRAGGRSQCPLGIIERHLTAWRGRLCVFHMQGLQAPGPFWASDAEVHPKGGEIDGLAHNAGSLTADDRVQCD